MKNNICAQLFAFFDQFDFLICILEAWNYHPFLLTTLMYGLLIIWIEFMLYLRWFATLDSKLWKTNGSKKLDAHLQWKEKRQSKNIYNFFLTWLFLFVCMTLILLRLVVGVEIEIGIFGGTSFRAQMGLSQWMGRIASYRWTGWSSRLQKTTYRFRGIYRLYLKLI